MYTVRLNILISSFDLVYDVPIIFYDLGWLAAVYKHVMYLGLHHKLLPEGI